MTNGIPASGWTIAIHNGPGLTNADQVLPIACVTIHNPRFRHLFHYDLDPTMAADQNVSGEARLSITQGHLMVTVVVHGLVPGSVHREHIYSGTCAHQGTVLYSLHNLVADAHGTATATTVIPNMTQIPAQVVREHPPEHGLDLSEWSHQHHQFRSNCLWHCWLTTRFLSFFCHT